MAIINCMLIDVFLSVALARHVNFRYICVVIRIRYLFTFASDSQQFVPVSLKHAVKILIYPSL